MRIIMSISVIIFLLSCSGFKKMQNGRSNSTLYLITKIKSKNDWNIIYVIRNDTPYKIITKKEKHANLNCIEQIIVGKYYNLILHSRKSNVPEINGIKIKPMNYLDVECYAMDETTNICIEPKKRIYDLYYADNIRGLCYIK